MGHVDEADGPYPTLCPERCIGHFDTVFQGEVEYTWPEFSRDFARDVKKAHYNQVDHVDIVKSPTPRNDLLDVEKYLYFYIQTTRGCPFTCGFCDIIVTDGRRPRTKMIERVVAEVEAVHATGGQYLSFSERESDRRPALCQEAAQPHSATGGSLTSSRSGSGAS